MLLRGKRSRSPRDQEGGDREEEEGGWRLQRRRLRRRGMGVEVPEGKRGKGLGLGWARLGWKGERGDESFMSFCLFVLGLQGSPVLVG